MSSITTKIHNLTDLIQDDTAPPVSRLTLLLDISEEAARLKMGADDKIRVASQAGDFVQAHQNYMTNVLKTVAQYDISFVPSRHTNDTTYPHVIARPFPHTSPMETGRRRRVPPNGSRSIANLDNPTPAKRRRVREEDDGTHIPKTQRRDRDKEVIAEREYRSQPRPRRPGSPADSVLSITSHAHQVPRAGQPNINIPSTPKVRSRPANHAHRGPGTPHNTQNLLDKVIGGREAYGSPSGASPMLGHSYPHTGPGMAYAGDSHHFIGHPNGAERWDGVDGAPILAGPGVSAEDLDGDLDPDEKTYCYCDAVSYGDMIACDDENCPREWFHLSCTGLVVPPKGTWYCDDCALKRSDKTKRSRGGKRRAAGTAGAGRTSKTANGSNNGKPVTAATPT